MKLVDMTIKDFCSLLGSEAPAPGGGSASALCGALGTALAGMVAALTLGKKKYAEVEPDAAEVLAQAEKLRIRLLDVMDRDTEAFHGMSAVFAMPKESEEEKTARRAAMQDALKACTRPPLEIMQLCRDALLLTRRGVGRFNASAASDLGVSALALKAGIQGAWFNVKINIGSVADEGFALECRAAGQALLNEALPLADEVYAQVLASL